MTIIASSKSGRGTRSSRQRLLSEQKHDVYLKTMAGAAENFVKSILWKISWNQFHEKFRETNFTQKFRETIFRENFVKSISRKSSWNRICVMKLSQKYSKQNIIYTLGNTNLEFLSPSLDIICEWQCKDRRSCIKKIQRCDGYPDCADLSDEAIEECSSTISRKNLRWKKIYMF